MTVFFLIGVSTVIVCGEYVVTVQSEIIFVFHCGARVGRGSSALRVLHLRATLRLFIMIFAVLSTSVICISNGVILHGERVQTGLLSESSLSEVGWSSDSEYLYCLAMLSSDIPSLLQSSSLVSKSCLRILLS